MKTQSTFYLFNEIILNIEDRIIIPVLTETEIICTPFPSSIPPFINAQIENRIIAPIKDSAFKIFKAEFTLFAFSIITTLFNNK